MKHEDAQVPPADAGRLETPVRQLRTGEAVVKVEVFKGTSENWFPSYKMDGGKKLLVKVCFTQTGPNPPTHGDWRVCVWGGDDCGMERDFSNEAEAWNCFLQVIGLEDVTRAALRGRGFSSA